MSNLNLGSPITALPGVGKVTAERLMKLGIHDLYDLVYFIPRAYEHRSEITLLSKAQTEIKSSFLLTVATEVKSVTIRRGMTISKFRAYDDSGSVEVVYYNTPYIKDVFHLGATFRFYGKFSYNKGRYQLVCPKYEPFVEGHPLPDFVPIYPLTHGLSSKQLDKLVRIALENVLPHIKDYLPEKIRTDNSLPTLKFALENAHCPENHDALSRSLKRLAFDEMLCFGIGISLSASTKKLSHGVRFSKVSLEPLTNLLPYELTNSQKSAVNDIYRDTVIGKNGAVSPMARIIVGDVGCGKTVCAIIAMYIAAKSGHQSALMVPTEILANQHFDDVSDILGRLGIRVELLLGSTKQREKKRIYEEIESGACQVVIGTHALLSDKFRFKSLGLIVTDEQHRFGVRQRALLKQKVESAHMLVMSATPIPRTLALTMYGDLDITRITDMPPGRQRVDTFVVDSSYKKRLNDFISKEVKLGGQCYIVCPSIDAEETEDAIVATDIDSMVPAKSLNLKSAIEYAEQLKSELPDLRIEVLHGRMKAGEKDAVMMSFASGDVDILVSTTVIEVGVNVPNASLMIVENAERFGLSQLHQLRGRVGRGKRKSYCVLVSDVNSEKSRARLEVMRTTYDGYAIAENDLMLRGPGDFFSSNPDINLRQSGGFEFKFASLCSSTDVLESAFSAAKAIICSDPALEFAEHAELKKTVSERINVISSTIS